MCADISSRIGFHTSTVDYDAENDETDDCDDLDESEYKLD